MFPFIGPSTISVSFDILWRTPFFLNIWHWAYFKILCDHLSSTNPWSIWTHRILSDPFSLNSVGKHRSPIYTLITPKLSLHLSPLKWATCPHNLRCIEDFQLDVSVDVYQKPGCKEHTSKQTTVDLFSFLWLRRTHARGTVGEQFWIVCCQKASQWVTTCPGKYYLGNRIINGRLKSPLLKKRSTLGRPGECSAISVVVEYSDYVLF